MPHFYRTSFKKKVKKIASVVMIVLLAVSLILVIASLVLRKSKEKESNISDRIAQELNPLENDLFLLENKLAHTEASYERAKLGNGAIVVLFNSPDEKIYTEAYPVMKEYKCKGVISLSRTQFPGLDGYMSEAQFEELLKNNWELCLTWDESSKNPFSDLEYLQSGVRKYTGINCSTVLFPQGSFSSEYLDELKKIGIDTVIHHGEHDLPIGAIDGFSDEIWKVGAYYWRSPAAIHNHQDVANAAKCVVYEIGFNSSLNTVCFDERQFSAMISAISEYKDEVLKLVGMEQARAIFIDKEFDCKNTPAEFETEIENLNNEINNKKEEISKLRKELRLPKGK